MNYALLSALLLMLPLSSFVVLGIWGRKYFARSGGAIGSMVLAAVAAISLYIAYGYFFVDGLQQDTYQPIKVLEYTWLQFGKQDIAISMGMLLDPISVMMLVVISLVSLMVHVFSLGYMKGEERYSTYFSFLSLFTFSMLGLVVSVNIFQLYMFWELVGISSYLLIGFYFTKPSAVAASKKAFIVTRFADFAFLIGILILGIQAGSLDFTTLIATLTNPQSEAFMSMSAAGFLGISVLSWALVLVFVGGAGKSAMFPLHVWLPDAMEGPTPVSALIHAATMVVAGVYLVARLFPIFQLDALAMGVVTWVGAISALFAAIIAITQTDIKRVLAYSTMSQIGYMMFALGVSGYGGENGLGFTGSLFHLFTHAFFKSLLFLGAGAVIHFVHSNEMTEMGGLRKYMPITHISFLIACQAIAGVPPLSGFFSKEEILLAAFEENKVIYAIALITAGLTAFYMFRLYFMIFWQQEKSYDAHHGEGTLSMKAPLIVLAAITLIAGFIPFSQYISSNGQPFSTAMHLAFSIAPVAMGIAGIGLAWMLYKKANDTPQKLAASFGSLYRAAHRKFYIDELYIFITHKIIFRFIGRPSAWFDRNVVDGAVDGTAATTENISFLIKGWQSGKIQQYLLYFFAGVMVLSFLFIYLWN